MVLRMHREDERRNKKSKKDVCCVGVLAFVVSFFMFFSDKYYIFLQNGLACTSLP